ncbi:hypothetical protein Tco_1110727 [Tanacetum coccineum]|uniref:Uncharacterized protein n=1 Tax=Tanacetum coccineum TaxID=301880 RepID=A0ABQ5IM64_9ASTR
MPPISSLPPFMVGAAVDWLAYGDDDVIAFGAVSLCVYNSETTIAVLDMQGQRVGLPDQALGEVNGGLLTVYQDGRWSHKAATEMCAYMVRPIAHFGCSSVHTEGVAPIYVDLGDCDQRCRHCGAMFWYEERGNHLFLNFLIA